MSSEIADPTQKLYIAVKDSFVTPEKIGFLLKHGADVNKTRGYSTTILMTAAENVLNSKVIDELLKAGADVNAVNKHGQTVLMRAAICNPNPEIIRMLIASGADVHFCGKHGNTILMMAAAENPNPFVIRELVRAGIDVNAVNNLGETALIIAVQNYSEYAACRDAQSALDIIRYLVRAGADTEIADRDGKTALSYAYEIESDEDKNPVLEFLRWHNDALFYVDWMKISPEQVRSLIYSGANVNGRRYTETCKLTPLTEACKKSNNPDVIETMITAGAADLDSALDTAMDWDNCEAARVLLLYGANVEYYGEESASTRLIWAAEHHSSPGMIELLIEAGADVNETDLSERTPLMFAVSNDQYVYNSKVIETLLSNGADVKCRDLYDKTALIYACQKINDLDTFSMLIKADSDVNAKDKYGCTPLMMACSKDYCSSDAVKLLLRAGADVNAQDNDGWTALFWAVANEDIGEAEEIIDALIFAGADIYIQDVSEYGKTALDVAVNIEARNILKELM